MFITERITTTIARIVPVEMFTTFVTFGTSVFIYLVCIGGCVSAISGISSPLIITFSGSSHSPSHVADGVSTGVLGLSVEIVGRDVAGDFDEDVEEEDEVDDVVDDGEDVDDDELDDEDDDEGDGVGVLVSMGWTSGSVGLLSTAMFLLSKTNFAPSKS